MAATHASAQSDELFRMQSDPGEDDAYGAPTKVGPMSKAAVMKMLQDAEHEQPAPRAPSPPSGVRPRVEMRQAETADESLPVLFDDEEEGLEPTRLTNRSAPPSPKSVAIVTRGPASIVASMVASALADQDELPTPPPVTIVPTTTAPTPATPARPVFAFPPPQMQQPAPMAPPRATFAFPQWTATPPVYMPAPPRPNAKFSDRTIAVMILSGAAGFVAVMAPFLWWLFN